MYFLLKMWAFVLPLWAYVLVGFCSRGFCPRGFCPRGFCPTLVGSGLSFLCSKMHHTSVKTNISLKLYEVNAVG